MMKLEQGFQLDINVKLLIHTTRYFDGKGQIYLKCLYHALFAAAFYGLLWVGELTSGSHPIFATDVQIALNKKIMFTLHTSKMHWHDNKPQIIKIRNTKSSSVPTQHVNSSQDENDKVCPYACLKQFVTIRPSCHSLFEPLFSRAVVNSIAL